MSPTPSYICRSRKPFCIPQSREKQKPIHLLSTYAASNEEINVNKIDDRRTISSSNSDLSKSSTTVRSTAIDMVMNIDDLEEYDIVEYQVLVLQGNMLGHTAASLNCDSCNGRDFLIEGNDIINHGYGIGAFLSVTELQQGTKEEANQSISFTEEDEQDQRENKNNRKKIEELLSRTKRLSQYIIHPLSRRHYEVEDITKEVENLSDVKNLNQYQTDEDIELFYDEEQAPFIVHVSDGDRDEEGRTTSTIDVPLLSVEVDDIKSLKAKQRNFFGKDFKGSTVIRCLRKVNPEDIYIQQRCIEDRLLNPHGEEAEDVFIIPLNKLSKMVLPITSRFVQL